MCEGALIPLDQPTHGGMGCRQLLIQNSQNRDAAAIQAKLDELIRATRAARNEFIGIEHLTDHQLEAIRTELEREGLAKDEELAAAHAAVSRLIQRN